MIDGMKVVRKQEKVIIKPAAKKNKKKKEKKEKNADGKIYLSLQIL
jgi:hypothetical protein